MITFSRLLSRVRAKFWKEFTKQVLPGSRHVEFSLISALDDEPGRPTQRLIDLAAQLVASTATMDSLEVGNRSPERRDLLETWPGEHYKLLKTICGIIKPSLAIEIGTFEGPSALAMLEGMAGSSRLVTFDIVPWDQVATTCLKFSDFKDGRLVQIVGDLSDESVFREHESLFEQADLIFLDGPKDVAFEKKFLARLETARLKKDLLLVVDDIRKWNMLKIWKSLDRPKLDFTSFGHWSGTGLVDWNG